MRRWFVHNVFFNILSNLEHIIATNGQRCAAFGKGFIRPFHPLSPFQDFEKDPVKVMRGIFEFLALDSSASVATMCLRCFALQTLYVFVLGLVNLQVFLCLI